MLADNYEELSKLDGFDVATVDNYIEEQGLGGVMLGVAPFSERMEKAAKAISLPDSLSVFTVVPFGYPAKKHPQQDRYDESCVYYIE